MAKDAKGHGSEKRGASSGKSLGELIHEAAERHSEGAAAGMSKDALVANSLAAGHPKSEPVPVHPGASGRDDYGQAGGRTTRLPVTYGASGSGRTITILHQDGEYAVPTGGGKGGKGHSFHNDKADAEGTARHMHGKDITIKHRSKRWGPEMD